MLSPNLTMSVAKAASVSNIWVVSWEKSRYSAVEPRYLELAYFELPLISKWKSGFCFNMKLWQQVIK